MDRLLLQVDQQRVEYRKVLAENESVLRQVKDEYSEKLESLRVTHQQEVKKILAQQALDHSTSRMAELQSKVDTQEVICILFPRTHKNNRDFLDLTFLHTILTFNHPEKEDF